MISTTLRARCDFDGLDAETILTVTSALVDQLCGHADVDVLFLDTIEVPLAVTVEAIARASREVSAVSVDVDNDELTIEFIVEGLGASPKDLLGTGLDLVASFFDLSIETSSGRLQMRGSLT